MIATANRSGNTPRQQNDTPASTATLLSPESAGQGAKRDAPEIVDSLLRQTFELGASDLHLLPTEQDMIVQWRIDGVLHNAGRIPRDLATNVTTRLKVLADLLTYETQTPQEGRLKDSPANRPVRLSTFPTLFGEKVVARVLRTGAAERGRLDDLELPAGAHVLLMRSLMQTSGAVVIVGPAGSGKTTTAYAMLREIVARTGGQRSVVSLEDPVEVVVPGVAQSQAAPHAGFDLHTGLRALVRQDPEVILLGEIRDAETARLAYQASLTGQLVITTFHAGDVPTAVSRLLDMGVPPYLLRGATRAMVAQRLVRRSCECQQRSGATLCSACQRTGYQGRQVIAEAVDFANPDVAQTIDASFDRGRLEATLQETGVFDLRSQANLLVKQGVTTQIEIERVLGS